MTEIKIEKRQPTWPWILLGLAIIALLIYFFGFRDKGKENKVTSELINVHENNSTVAAFVSFVNNDDEKMGLDHRYTSEALIKLAQATDVMAAEIDYNLQNDFNQVKTYATEITNDPSATTHADAIRKAADILSTSLQNMQKAKYPELMQEGEELKKAAAAIDPNVLTLHQKDAIKTFFSKAADLLQKMN